MVEPLEQQRFILANQGRALNLESITIHQAGLHAYSQVCLVNAAEALQGGMHKSNNDDDNYQRASNEKIPFMQASLNKSVSPEALIDSQKNNKNSSTLPQS